MSALGTDIATPVSTEGLLDLDPTFALATGRVQLAQAIGRRITTRRGTLAWIGDDPDYGDDSKDFLGSDADSTAAFRIAARVQAEILGDERVLGCEVAASITDGLLTLSIRLADATGPFRLVLAISGVTIELLRVTQ